MTEPGAVAFDPHASYIVGEQVVLRREAFGALAYDLRSRALRVLRDPDLVTVLERLDGVTSADAVVASVAAAKRRTMLAALARLEREGMIHVA